MRCIIIVPIKPERFFRLIGALIPTKKLKRTLLQYISDIRYRCLPS